MAQLPRHAGYARHPRKPKVIDKHQQSAIAAALSRTIAYRNVGKDQAADMAGEHLLRLLHSTGVLGANQWRT
jgi:hypothetical protein